VDDLAIADFKRAAVDPHPYCRHKVALRVIAERLDERAVGSLLEIDEPPGSEQSLMEI
jgi:hypothetical protein